MPFAEAEIARLATPQHGVVSRAQLLEAGLNSDGIDYRVRVGRLHRLHRGVYAVGHRPPSPHARAMAAVLACGPGAVLSHRSAAALWGITSPWRGEVDVTSTTKHQHRGITTHRSRTLESQDTTTHYGIPTTTLARTVLDLTAVLDDRALARAVNEARLKGLTAEHLSTLRKTTNGRASARLGPFIEQAAPTRSTFEDAFLAFAQRHGLPRPIPNQTVEGHEVDMLWPEQRLIVELDSRTHHDHATAFETDRDRDATLLVSGHRTVRVTWTRMTRQPRREADRLRTLLTQAPRIAVVQNAQV